MSAGFVTPALLAPPPLPSPGELQIPQNFPSWVPPMLGMSPAQTSDLRGWWPINSAQQAALCSPAQLMLYGGQSGGGKDLDLDTPLPTPSGWVAMRDVRLGDTLLDEQGDPCAVVCVQNVNIADSYKVIFDDGSEIVASGTHRWFTTSSRERDDLFRKNDAWRAKRRSKRPSRAIADPRKRSSQLRITALNQSRKYEYSPLPLGSVRDTNEIHSSLIGLRGESNHYIPVAKALVLPEKNLPVNPYVLGAWLGDGTHYSGGFTGIDAGIWEEIERCGYRVRHSKTDPSHHHIHKLIHGLRLCGVLRNKHIPAEYLRSSIQQRIDLLSGLMDTDGHCTKSGQCEFDNTNYALIQGVMELVLSLGIKATICPGVAKIKGRVIGPKWRIKFVTTFQVFRLGRKLRRQKLKIRQTAQRRYIVSVEKVLDRPMRCIAVDSPSHLYLAGRQMIPTHNSDFLVGDAMQEYMIPSFRGLLLRESLGEFDQIGDRMEKAYLPLGAKYRQRNGGGQWIFPQYELKRGQWFPIFGTAGARIRFGYLASDNDLKKYRGNPYSWLGIDESGLHPLKRVRQMIGWLASVDKRLRVRARFASNPGGVGHGWQMAVFLRNRCPLHYPPSPDRSPETSSVVAGRVYSGAAWSWPISRAELVHKTTAFFPASVTDNPLYGQEKVDSLLSQTPEIQMQLLHGCWCNAQSLYFGFLQPEWMVPYPAIDDQWWWNHIISIDYGYGNSWAAAGLYAIDNYGRMFGTREMTEQKMISKDFAEKICQEWIVPRMGEEKIRILFATIDPANDNEDGTGETNYDIIAGIFSKYGVSLIKSHKNPADNAQKLYSGLASRELILTDGMRQTFNAVATRIIDERKAVKKIHGDPDDDRYDQLAYAYNTWLVEAVKPERMKLMERAKKMREDGVDETSIARFTLSETRKIAQKESQNAKGLPLGGRRI